MFIRSISLVILSLIVSSAAQAQGRSAHPAERSRAAAAREYAAAHPDSEDGAPNAPRPDYASRRFRVTVAFRSGIFALPKYDLGFFALGASVGFGAQISDEVAVIWDVSAMLGDRPVDETEDNEDDGRPLVDVNLSVGLTIRRQVARRYFDVGPTLVNHWMAAGDGFSPIGVGGGMRFGAGAFLMRKNGQRARTLGGEIRIERVAEAPSLTLDFRWGAAF